jgi:hypothetical protein
VLEAAIKQSTPSTSASSSKVFNSSSASAAAETHTRQCVTSDQQSHGAEAYSREFVEFKDRLDRRMVHMQVSIATRAPACVCFLLITLSDRINGA